MLQNIKKYLQSRQQASLGDIALHFRTDAEAIRGMLDRWILKGKVEKDAAPGGCQSRCCGCTPEHTEIYRWREK